MAAARQRGTSWRPTLPPPPQGLCRDPTRLASRSAHTSRWVCRQGLWHWAAELTTQSMQARRVQELILSILREFMRAYGALVLLLGAPPTPAAPASYGCREGGGLGNTGNRSSLSHVFTVPLGPLRRGPSFHGQPQLAPPGSGQRGVAGLSASCCHLQVRAPPMIACSNCNPEILVGFMQARLRRPRTCAACQRGRQGRTLQQSPNRKHAHAHAGACPACPAGRQPAPGKPTNPVRLSCSRLRCACSCSRSMWRRPASLCRRRLEVQRCAAQLGGEAQLGLGQLYLPHTRPRCPPRAAGPCRVGLPAVGEVQWAACLHRAAGGLPSGTAAASCLRLRAESNRRSPPLPRASAPPLPLPRAAASALLQMDVKSKLASGPLLGSPGGGAMRADMVQECMDFIRSTVTIHSTITGAAACPPAAVRQMPLPPRSLLLPLD